MPEREGDEGEPAASGGGRRGEAPTREAPTQVLDEEDARLARLERLGELRDKGILTDEEFAAEKARILSRDAQSV